MKLLKDHPSTVEFATQAGRLIQNFGVIELLSFRWIELLAKSSVAAEISQELTLSKRIDIIVKLIERDTPQPEKKDDAVRLWKQLRDKGCELRNVVAHGTIGLQFADDPETANPQTSGVLKLKKWAPTDELVSLQEVKDAVIVTARIAEELIGHLETVGSQPAITAAAATH